MKKRIWVATYVLAFLVPPVVVSAVGVQAALANRYAPAPVDAHVAADRERPTPSRHDPGKPTAVVLLNHGGTEITDALAPYEVFAESEAFNTYTVAPEPGLVTLSGGVEVLPQLSFAELDRLGNGQEPDVVVVPAMWDVGSAGQRPVADWLRRHAGGVGTLMSVCDGAEVLADAGLLVGHRATANWANLDRWARRHPDTEWVRGKRYVEDGNVLTSAGVTSGTSAALHVVRRHVGEPAAQQLARKIGYPDLRLGAEPAIPADRLTAADRALYVLGGAYDWNRSRVGVVLTEGISEIELASAFDAYPGPAFTSRSTSLAAGGPSAPVVSEHGLTLVPRHGLDGAAPALDRLLVPGRDAASTTDPRVTGWAQERGLVPAYVHAEAASGYPFDATLTDLARHENAPLAHFTARLLEYPSGHLDLIGPGWPYALWLRPLAVGLLGLVLAVAVHRLIVRR